MLVSTSSSPESVPAATPHDSGEPRRRTSVSALAVVCLVVIASAVGYVLYSAFQEPGAVNVPAHVVAYLANASLWLDVPLMTLYTAPALQERGFNTNMSLSMWSFFDSPSANVTFRWGNVSGIGEPVRFVLAPTVGDSSGTAFRRGPSDGFIVLPAGNATRSGSDQGWEHGISTEGSQNVYHELWRMNYSAVRMSETVSSAERRWLQVNYSLVDTLGIFDALPSANTSAPSTGDWVAVSGNVTLVLPKGATYYTLQEVHNVTLPAGPFRHTMSPLGLYLGGAGYITASLTSEFGWGAGAHYWLGWGVGPTNGANITWRYVVDARFGSLALQFLP